MIDHLLYQVALSPHSEKIYAELKQDLKALLSTPNQEN